MAFAHWRAQNPGCMHAFSKPLYAGVKRGPNALVCSGLLSRLLRMLSRKLAEMQAQVANAPDITDVEGAHVSAALAQGAGSALQMNVFQDLRLLQSAPPLRL